MSRTTEDAKEKGGKGTTRDRLIISMAGSEPRGVEPHQYTVYFLNCEWNKKTWQVEKRFSQFAALLKELQTAGIKNLPSLPPKTWFKRMDKDFVAKRKGSLETLISQLGLHMEVLAERVFLDFVEFDDNTVSGAHLNRSLAFQDFEVMAVLGKGSFGKVYQVRKKDTGKVYAMKVLKKPQVVLRKQVAHTKTERMVLQEINHPFLVSLRFAFQTTDTLFMVLDVFEGGELFTHLRKEGYFTQERTQFYMGELILAMEALHDKGIVYRDLKPENVLLDAEGHIRLTDFGLSKLLPAEAATATFCGTPEYLAPEVVAHKEYGFMVDWWTVGTFCYELLCGRTPFSGDASTGRVQLKQLYERILHAQLEFPPHVSDVAKDFCARLLERDPKKRFGSEGGAAQVKAHPFFAGLDWVKLLAMELETPFKPPKNSAVKRSGPSDRILASPLESTLGALEFDGFTYNPTPGEVGEL